MQQQAKQEQFPQFQIYQNQFNRILTPTKIITIQMIHMKDNYSLGYSLYSQTKQDSPRNRLISFGRTNVTNLNQWTTCQKMQNLTSQQRKDGGLVRTNNGKIYSCRTWMSISTTTFRKIMKKREHGTQQTSTSVGCSHL